MSSELGAGSDQNSALIVTWGPRWGCSWKVIPSQLEASSMSTSVHIIVCFLWFLWSSHQHRLHCRGSIPWANTSSPPLMRLGWAMGRWFTKQRRLWSTDFQSVQSKVQMSTDVTDLLMSYVIPFFANLRIWVGGCGTWKPPQSCCCRTCTKSAFSSVYCGTLLPWKETQGTAHIFLDLVDDSRGNDFQVPVTSSPSPPSGRRKVTQDQFMVTWLRRLLFQPHLTYWLHIALIPLCMTYILCHHQGWSCNYSRWWQTQKAVLSSYFGGCLKLLRCSFLLYPTCCGFNYIHPHSESDPHNWSKPPWCGLLQFCASPLPSGKPTQLWENHH